MRGNKGFQLVKFATARNTLCIKICAVQSRLRKEPGGLSIMWCVIFGGWWGKKI
jgi:hypothetical protein